METLLGQDNLIGQGIQMTILSHSPVVISWVFLMSDFAPTTPRKPVNSGKKVHRRTCFGVLALDRLHGLIA